MTLASIFGNQPFAGFDPIGQDVLLGQGGRLRRRGTVISYDTFDGANFSGWMNHFHYARPSNPLSMDDQITMGGSSHSLRLAPAVRDIAAANGNAGGAFKRHNRPADSVTGLISFSGFFAMRGDGSLETEDWPFSSWGLAFDTQRWDNTSRDFPQVVYMTRSAGQKPAWHVRVVKDNGSVEMRVIPGTAGLAAGLNERKANTQYVRLTWQLDRGDGRGRYYELQVGGQCFDLRHILLTGESAFDHVLKDTSWDHFTGTVNTGLIANRAAARTMDLLAGQLVTTYNDQGV